MSRVDDDPILNLRDGIVRQAAQDYVYGFTYPEDPISGKEGSMKLGKHLRNECKEAFRGEWFALLLSGLDGEAMLQKLTKQTLEELTKRKEHNPMKVTLVQAPANPISLIADIASICYDSKINSKKALVKQLYLNGHHSVFEHVQFTWKLENISRACSHQLVRHRMATITQRSQRYCEENGFDFVTPESIARKDSARDLYLEQMDKINDIYIKLIHLMDIKREDARFLLPNACVTEMYFSCNLREFIHICNERLCSRAQWEIRELVRQMADTLPADLQYMLKPKCESGFLICAKPCHGTGYVLPDNNDEKKGKKKA